MGNGLEGWMSFMSLPRPLPPLPLQEFLDRPLKKVSHKYA